MGIEELGKKGYVPTSMTAQDIWLHTDMIKFGARAKFEWQPASEVRNIQTLDTEL